MAAGNTIDDAARQYYKTQVAEGVDRFFQDRRPDCPWCGSVSIGKVFHSRDVLQAKPGTFVLDRCRACGHIFQNPQLNIDGLNFYYRNSSDLVGTKGVDLLVMLARGCLRRRALMVQPYAAPRKWLDVGASYGHFCRVARQLWPNTTFDGVDIDDGILVAQRRGWIDKAYQGMFHDLAPTLPERYDMVSMHQYLEHTIDPRRELQLAAQVLNPGGHVLIEVPDPECPPARLFGRYWYAWTQPQHLHMFPLDNLKEALTSAGFTIKAVERRSDVRLDFSAAARILLFMELGPKPGRAWAPRPATPIDHARRIAALALGGLAIPACVFLDQTLGRLLLGNRNAYRVLAAKSP
ncbi:class I SAM-dependent methyltransferase [Streptomyces pharetrae]|uniref:class I SAM-dependent methyltransferase n=1 Tax=Streptomyces pharetrae TaxID=291370 RepID=UPI0033615C22